MAEIKLLEITGTCSFEKLLADYEYFDLKTLSGEELDGAYRLFKCPDILTWEIDDEYDTVDGICEFLRMSTFKAEFDLNEIERLKIRNRQDQWDSRANFNEILIAENYSHISVDRVWNAMMEEDGGWYAESEAIEELVIGGGSDWTLDKFESLPFTTLKDTKVDDGYGNLVGYPYSQVKLYDGIFLGVESKLKNVTLETDDKELNMDFSNDNGGYNGDEKDKIDELIQLMRN